MSFVFISHASEDKPRVKPVVDALIKEGFKVWLDDPVAAGYSAEEALSFYRIPAGGRWEDEIDRAKRYAACILVCWSQRATASGVMNGKERLTWMGEVDYGRVEDKLVACTVDDVSPAALPGGHAAQQMPCLDPVALPPETWRAAMATLITDVHRKVYKRTIGSKARLDLALPLLANRAEQEVCVYAAISLAVGVGGAHPVILKGPENELPDAFIRRMERVSSELSRDGEAWFQWRMDWPKEASSARDFDATYRRHLWRKLGLVGRADNLRIAEHLEQLGLSAVLHRVHAKHWRRREEPELIKAWLDYWAAVTKHGRRIKVVPILVVPLPQAKPGWRTCPNMGSGGRVGVRDIWKSVRRFVDGDQKPSDLNVIVPPILSPITVEHGKDWLGDELAWMSDHERARIEAELVKMFARGRAKRHGVSHEEFNTRLAPLCAKTT